MRKLHVSLLVLGVVFLGWLLWKIGLVELWRELTALGWGLVPLLLLEGLAEMVHTVGLRFCLSGPHRHLPFLRLYQIRMAGYAINYITPTAALGGELSRVGLLATYASGTEAASAVLIDKACFAVGHLLIVLVGSVFILFRVPLAQALRVAMMVAMVPMTVGIIAFILLQSYGKFGAVARWLAARKFGGARLGKAAQHITALDGAFRAFYRDRPGDFVFSVAWHLVGFSVLILQTWLFLGLLHQSASFGVAVGAWLLGLWMDLLTFAVPLNLGTLEGGRVMIFKALGYGALLGATYGVLVRLAQVGWTIFGLVNYGLLLRRPHLSASKPATIKPRTSGRPTFEPL